VDRKDSVLVSIRKLAYAARAWHEVPPASTGYNQEAVTFTNERLFQAVRTVDGHLLMVTVNGHTSEENVIRLRKELADHDVRLDSYAARVNEANQRLELGNLRAYHATGVTQSDLQALTGALIVFFGVK
jgi:hypothetical protein